ncbi:hypothetical protein STEG23_016975, partial [Scotinomys teguina]
LTSLFPCCLALDSSSSFPCPTFLVITKSYSIVYMYHIFLTHQRNANQNNSEIPSYTCQNS